MNQTTQQIIQTFENYRMSPAPNDQYESKGKQILIDKIDSFVLKNQTIDFVMLGFPFKSTNTRDKVLGTLPDLGEQLTVNNFIDFNEDIKKVYSPGVKISIASDGLVFNQLLNVSEYSTEKYLDIVSEDMARYAPMRFYTLNNFYSHDTNTNREKLVSQFGISELELENLIITNENVNYLYRGMMKFMNEELQDKNYPNNSQIQKAAKKITREMMKYNEAWSRLVNHEFRSHIRISMHPSVNNGEKYSFQLIRGKNIRHSAWHCVIVQHENGYETMHKKDAVAAGYELMYKSKQPFYFQA